MAKTRVSLSLDPDDAELIRQVAADNGLDVSAFLVMAARKEATRLSRLAATFSDLDAAIEEAEAEVDALPWPPDPAVDPKEAARIHTDVATARARSAARRHGGANA